MKTECRSGAFAYNGKIYPCTLSVAMDLVGGKWKAVILYHLQEGSKRFGELHSHLRDATETILSRQLKQLEHSGLVSRRVYGSKPPLRSEYALTEFGRSFLPVLAALTEWGNRAVIERGSFIDPQAPAESG
ncbi:helix-turn-helix domain-containing protein [Kingella sp. SNUBH-2017]|jgi:site-specific recombinase, phage integrase family|uniref:Helix-turn-helix transcriptional regulator n=1 Tax=Kingella pumchi TaxID=2779506 RepID=A0ABS9NLJ5_9NEIS|nr:MULTISPECIES: helix-turn-helix domain-containing protein [Kingella]MCG6503676.1 helix-turn-helix transcriptional regulator [Kingella pumchi]MDD2182418.1 helix-turn-helix domain-containing protein [Kingella sp. SNUBH-2017]